MTTHSGCFWDYPEDVVLAYGKARGLRLIVASARDDDDEKDAVLEEIGDCVQCLRHTASFLSSAAAGVGASLAENAGADEAAAVRRWETLLAEATADLPD